MFLRGCLYESWDGISKGWDNKRDQKSFLHIFLISLYEATLIPTRQDPT